VKEYDNITIFFYIKQITLDARTKIWRYVIRRSLYRKSIV